MIAAAPQKIVVSDQQEQIAPLGIDLELNLPEAPGNCLLGQDDDIEPEAEENFDELMVDEGVCATQIP